MLPRHRFCPVAACPHAVCPVDPIDPFKASITLQSSCAVQVAGGPTEGKVQPRARELTTASFFVLTPASHPPLIPVHVPLFLSATIAFTSILSLIFMTDHFHFPCPTL